MSAMKISDGHVGVVADGETMVRREAAAMGHSSELNAWRFFQRTVRRARIITSASERRLTNSRARRSHPQERCLESLARIEAGHARLRLRR